MATFVVEKGLQILANRFKSCATGTYATEPAFVGWGTQVTPTYDGDETALFAEKADDLTSTSGSRGTAGTTSLVNTTHTEDTWQCVKTRTATGSGTVTEAGCFDSATIAAGNLYMAGDFTGIGLSSGDSIEFTFKSQFTH